MDRQQAGTVMMSTPVKVGISVTSVLINVPSPFHLANNTLSWMSNFCTIFLFPDHVSSQGLCVCFITVIIVITIRLATYYFFILHCHLNCCLLLNYCKHFHVIRYYYWTALYKPWFHTNYWMIDDMKTL